MDIFVGKTGNQLCPVTTILSYMVARGPGDSPFSTLMMGSPSLDRNLSRELRRPSQERDFTAQHSFQSGAAKLLLLGDLVMQPSRCWGAGRVVPTSYI